MSHDGEPFRSGIARRPRHEDRAVMGSELERRSYGDTTVVEIRSVELDLCGCQPGVDKDERIRIATTPGAVPFRRRFQRMADRKVVFGKDAQSSVALTPGDVREGAVAL